MKVKTLTKNFIISVQLVMMTAIFNQNLFAQSWQWIAFGDTRNDKPEHKQVLQSIMANTPDYKFIINVGDVVDHGDIESEWIDWYNTTTSVLGDLGQDQIPPKYMAIPGNHDATETTEGLANWNKYLPGQVEQFGNEGKFFTFDYENARFIIMDSDKSSKTGAQLTMMMNAIQNNPKTWLFMITHRPIFEFGPYSYRDDLHNEWGVPLYQYGCDFIFMGHDHFYLRTKKLELDGNINPPLDPEKGTVQVITANGGASLKDINPEKDGNGYIVAAYIKDHGYTELTVMDDSLRLRHILKDGTVFDEVFYKPNPKPGSTGIDENAASDVTPLTYQLSQNYPNPFHSNTKIFYQLPRSSQVEITVFDVLGREVALLMNENQPAGAHTVEWRANDNYDMNLPGGVYFYRLRAGSFIKTMKMVLLH